MGLLLPLMVLILTLSTLSSAVTQRLITQDSEVLLNKSQVRLLGLVALFLTLAGSLIPLGMWQAQLTQTEWPKLVLAISFTTLLVITALVDAATRYIYDMLLLIFSAVHVVLLILIKTPWQEPVYGALLGGGLYLAIRLISQWVFKKEAFGLGDVYLMAAIGLVIGFKYVLLVGLEIGRASCRERV